MQYKLSQSMEKLCLLLLPGSGAVKASYTPSCLPPKESFQWYRLKEIKSTRIVQEQSITLHTKH